MVSMPSSAAKQIPHIRLSPRRSPSVLRVVQENLNEQKPRSHLEPGSKGVGKSHFSFLLSALQEGILQRSLMSDEGAKSIRCPAVHTSGDFMSVHTPISISKLPSRNHSRNNKITFHLMQLPLYEQGHA